MKQPGSARRNPLARFSRWLHLGFPAGVVEPLPAVNPDFSTNVPGLFVIGDLAGVPLLKFAAESGRRVIETIAASRSRSAASEFDVVIIGGGVAGMSAALEARRHGLRFVVLEAVAPFATIADFPVGKPIYTYPADLELNGELRFGVRSDVKEGLYAELREQTADVAIERVRVERVERERGALVVLGADGRRWSAPAVIVAIGRSGEHRRLGVLGEDLPKVFHRLHDPAEFAGKDVLVVGGGDTALETALALAHSGARVTLSYRGAEFARGKAENVEAVLAASRSDSRARDSRGRLTLEYKSDVERIEASTVVLRVDRTPARPASQSLPNDAVFVCIGRAAPLGFFRASGVTIRGEWNAKRALSLAAMLLFCVFLYNWKAGGDLKQLFESRGWFPFGLRASYESANASAPTALTTILLRAMTEPGFWYAAAYCVVMLVFGVRRVRRRKTPYVRLQTITLVAIQIVPLFLLPYILLPWFDRLGAFDAGFGKALADQLIPIAAWNGEREYWRAFGLLLAWPLFVWNVFTDSPTTGWLVISVLQTFVLIPLLVWRYGKGAYCGWICSCGGLAETLGDAHREKMPHGPRWNRLNLLGQAILAVCFVLLALRVGAWLAPGSTLEHWHKSLLSENRWFSIRANYYWGVDLLLAGILGLGLYFHFSGRTWCRFACPLAALMHIYARFSRFRIFAEKKKCISCNVCTTVCHQGIDVMAFAQRGQPMDDPQCVRCSACVSSCPTGVLRFGALDPKTGTRTFDALSASNVRASESAESITSRS